MITNEIIQQILVYATLLAAAGYLVKKFLLPKTFRSPLNGKKKACGSDDCGCH
ncbi:hypothetical protein [Robertkochia aurantiaca]|uniref:hypothetical protein n=1 Tax=Robertkochia aurantiaca TaxID=2873700 RepID=UPI001CCA39B3|nr:hypothetical protein [Robertkochia sp. 3YJGBD-33]